MKPSRFLCIRYWRRRPVALLWLAVALAFLGPLWWRSLHPLRVRDQVVVSAPATASPAARLDARTDGASLVLVSPNGLPGVRLRAGPDGGRLILYNARGAPVVVVKAAEFGGVVQTTDHAGMGGVVVRALPRDGEVVITSR